MTTLIADLAAIGLKAVDFVDLGVFAGPLVDEKEVSAVNYQPSHRGASIGIG
ncbi:hypothetical protein [Roseimicrobium gellanilyticum]|uniref:hypothetical protein n=1 Tax=Roseimicrobium gellanilyticum TaxID=748857 RepID=UPI00147529E6|nr:hypothetical protein [Roseimicrobium gellanilyticum]